MKVAFSIMFSFLFFFAVAKDQNNVPASIYSFKVAAFNGSTIDLSQYRGKKILIVNTPEEADYSRQYAELETLYQKYKDKLVIIGFLANDFQIEPGSKKHTSFQKNYPVTFPLAAKVMVRGDDMAPIYKWLTEKKYNNFQDTEVGWDFHKFLINENGALIAVFDPKTKPSSPEIISTIEK